MQPWVAPVGYEQERVFLFSKMWLGQFNALPHGGVGNKKVLGFGENGSVRQRLGSWIDAFVIGEPQPNLLRLNGAMNPTFARLNPPNDAVVYIRTTDVRIFGFIAEPKKYVALSLGEIAAVKGPQPTAGNVSTTAPVTK